MNSRLTQNEQQELFTKLQKHYTSVKEFAVIEKFHDLIKKATQFRTSSVIEFGEYTLTIGLYSLDSLVSLEKDTANFHRFFMAHKDNQFYCAYNF